MGRDAVRDQAAAPVAAASVTSSATAMVVWAVDRWVFRSSPVPPEVYGFLQVVVPAAMGFLGAEVVHWRRKRHATTDV